MSGARSGYGATSALGSTSENCVAVAWRSRWFILICILLCLAAGFIYIQTATPIYTTTARLYLEYVSLLPLTTEAGRIPQAEKYLQTQAALIKSRPIIAAAVQKLSTRQLQTLKHADVPAALLAKSIQVEVGRRDDIITISLESPFSVEAAQIVNSVVEAYKESRSEHEQRNAVQVLEILQRDLSRVEKDRLLKQEQLEEFQTNQMPLALGSQEGGTLIQRRMEGLQTELGRVQADALAAELFRDAVNDLASDANALQQYLQSERSTGTYFASAPERSSLESRLTDLDLQIGTLMERWTESHPAVTALREQRAVLQARLAELDARFVAAVTASAEQLYRKTKEQERQLAVLYEEQRAQIVALSAELSQHQRLRSELDRLAEHAQTLETQVGEIARIVNEDVGQLRMAILEPAVPSERPSAPQKTKVMTLALLLGLLLGGGFALARDWLDQSLRSADEVSAMLHLPALGIIPLMSRRMTVPTRGLRVFLEPSSREAEAFRSVRTAVFFGAPKDKARTILITSPSAGDGKSTVVSNLGIAMATAGQKTIIVDADLRKPMQKSIFEIERRELYMEDVLEGKAPLVKALSATRIPNLHVLACRSGLNNPAELLNSPRFAKLLQCLSKGYERVLVDAPPVTVVTDAQILSASCDVTVLVLRADKTTRKMAQRAVMALQNVGARVLGVVVNQISRDGDRYGYCGHYKYDYGSGTNGDRKKAKGLSEQDKRRSDLGRVASVGR